MLVLDSIKVALALGDGGVVVEIPVDHTRHGNFLGVPAFVQFEVVIGFVAVGFQFVERETVGDELAFLLFIMHIGKHRAVAEGNADPVECGEAAEHVLLRLVFKKPERFFCLEQGFGGGSSEFALFA